METNYQTRAWTIKRALAQVGPLTWTEIRQLLDCPLYAGEVGAAIDYAMYKGWISHNSRLGRYQLNAQPANKSDAERQD